MFGSDAACTGRLRSDQRSWVGAETLALWSAWTRRPLMCCLPCADYGVEHPADFTASNCHTHQAYKVLSSSVLLEHREAEQLVGGHTVTDGKTCGRGSPA